MKQLFIYGIISVAVFLAPASGAESNPPNIVLIVADDLGYGDLGCYGNKENKTPAIDSLADSGVLFTDFHSSGPMCTPTRASLLTGRYQQRLGPEFDGALSGKTQRSTGLPHGTVTIAEALKEKGYATACYGKWHLGYEPPWLPPSHGFDEFRGLASGDGDHHTQIDRSGNEDWWNGESIAMEKGYTADLLTKYSLDFIQRNQDRPFFLYLPHLAIHFPWQGPDDPPHRQKGKDYSKDKWGVIPDPGNVSPHVKGMIESLDQSVGAVVSSLEKLGLREDTLVIFTSDNGGYLTYGKNFRNISSNGPFRGQKTEIYEGGHRVPTIISWPGKISPGVSDETAHSNDIFPTILGALNAENTWEDFDGYDLFPHLENQTPLADRMLFWRMRDRSAVRDGKWKLCGIGKRLELYDLESDPGETKDLSEENPEILSRLLESWEDWNKKMARSAEALRAE
ncbi:MAG: sulfatase [Verrucomicrobiales bacterium]|nr:sulfatase [Verrucomicrobiales bacterium]